MLITESLGLLLGNNFINEFIVYEYGEAYLSIDFIEYYIDFLKNVTLRSLA